MYVYKTLHTSISIPIHLPPHVVLSGHPELWVIFAFLFLALCVNEVVIVFIQ